MVEKKIRKAVQYFEAGDQISAESLLIEIIKKQNNNFAANYILGLVYAQTKNYQNSILYLEKACHLNSLDPSVHYNLAKVLMEASLVEKSLAHHEMCVQLNPENANAWFNYGKALIMLKRDDHAVDCFKKTQLLNPQFLEAYISCGRALTAVKKYNEALIEFNKALEIRPDYPEAWLSRGDALYELRKYDEALIQFDKALELRPDYPEAWLSRGMTFKAVKKYDEALIQFDKALELRPDYPEAWLDRGVTLYELRKYDEALIQFDKALELRPDYPEGWLNRAIALYANKNMQDAFFAIDKALEKKNNFFEAMAIKASLFDEIKQYDRALESYEKAIKINHSSDWILGNAFFCKMKICNWNNYDIELKRLKESVLLREKTVTPFNSLTLFDDPSLQKTCADLYAENYFFSSNKGFTQKIHNDTKISIGYFSGDFRKHAVSLLIGELFDLHDYGKFKVYLFSFGPDDGSLIRNNLKNNPNTEFIDLNSYGDFEAAIICKEKNLDIAVDLGGFTEGGRPGLFVNRVAPIQVSYLGYLGTLGLNSMDYILSDKVLITDKEISYYSEKIAFLPSYQVNDRRRFHFGKNFSREELFLPKDCFVFCCMNNNYKITPKMFESWMKILVNTKNSILLLYAENKSIEKNLINEATKRGISSDRLIFCGTEIYENYLSRYKLCDLFLDTFPYNAGTTASDALWTGLPIITLRGQSFPSRIASSLLTAINVPELITTSQSEYETMAIELARDAQKHNFIKKKIQTNRDKTPLFDTLSFTRNLERVFIEMFENYRFGLHPDHIDIFS